MESPTEPQVRARPPRRRNKFAIGGLAVFLVLIGLVVWATNRPGSVAFYMTPTELLAAGPGELDANYRVNGTVLPGSIDQQGLVTTFVITDGTTEIDVSTDRPLPDTFKERSEVVARGLFDGDTFVADEVLAKCPSKFKARA